MEITSVRYLFVFVILLISLISLIKEISNLPQYFSSDSVDRLAKHIKYWTCSIIKIFTLCARENPYFPYFHSSIRFFDSMCEVLCIVLQMHGVGWCKAKDRISPGVRSLGLGENYTWVAASSKKKASDFIDIKVLLFLYWFYFICHHIFNWWKQTKTILYANKKKKKTRKKGHVLYLSKKK